MGRSLHGTASSAPAVANLARADRASERAVHADQAAEQANGNAAESTPCSKIITTRACENPMKHFDGLRCVPRLCRARYRRGLGRAEMLTAAWKKDRQMPSRLAAMKTSSFH
jgi:hypothetical protein